jgi:type II secretory ATPase GspE/PulE/Tfp pilus assembly ATPase PilB-like protein
MSNPTHKDSASPAAQKIEELIRQAEKAGASDIHLQMVNGTTRVSFRLDGVMTPVAEFDTELAERILGRVKYLAHLKTYQDSLPQDGRIDGKDLSSTHDVRVSTYPTVTGEKIVLRLFTDSAAKSLRELELPEEVCGELERFLHKSTGLLLLTGPAGSGKTTTIYACLRHLAETGGRQIITIEDPVEQVLPGIMQTEINDARGLTYPKAARHLLRQDPQVLVIGEIRDDETAGLVVRAALTGHLVISTLHAGSCAGVMERLLVMCPDHHATFSVIELILNQRLIRRLCPDCQGKRCDKCLQTGYRGRVPVVEWIRFDDTLRAQIRTQGAASLKPKTTLSEAARRFVERRLTDEAECRRLTEA